MPGIDDEIEFTGNDNARYLKNNGPLFGGPSVAEVLKGRRGRVVAPAG
jgi:hypothetical protein